MHLYSKTERKLLLICLLKSTQHLQLFIVVFLCSGYLVTSPRIFRAGSTQKLSVSLFSVPEPWMINATVSHSKGGKGIIASGGTQVTSLSDGTLDLMVCF